MILAAVVRIDPNHPDPCWGSFFLVLLGVFGCLLVWAGAYLTNGLWRFEGEKPWLFYVLGPVVLAIGFAIAVPSLCFAFHLL